MKNVIGILSVCILFASCGPSGNKKDLDTSVGNGDSILVSEAVMVDLGKQFHGFIASNGDWIFKEKLNAAGELSEGLIFVESADWTGFINLNGERIIKTNFSGDFHEGMVRISENNENKPFGFMDKSGKTAIPLKYNAASDFREGLAAVMSDGKWGYIDKNGEEVIPFKYSRALDFRNDMAVVCTNEGNNQLCGVINKSGKEIVPLKFQEVGELNSVVFRMVENVFPVTINYRSGLSNTQGENVTPLIYDQVKYFGQNYFLVKKGGQSGILDKGAKEIIPLGMYDISVKDETGTMYVVDKNKDLTALYDKYGKQILPFKYTRVSGFVGGLAIVSTGHGQSERYGYINEKMEETIPCQYSEVGEFTSDLAYVRDPDQWTFVKIIDKSGKVFKKVPTPDRSRLTRLGKFAVMTLAGETPDLDVVQLLNSRGDVVIKPKYQEIREFSEGLAAIKLNDLWGFIDSDGKEIISPTYKAVQDFRFGRSVVEKADDDGFSRVVPYAVIDKQGNVITRDSYSSISGFRYVHTK
jgi:hypothetical protein